MSLSNQIEQEISAVIEPIKAHRPNLIVPNKIADIVQKRLDPEAKAPPLMAHLSVMRLRDEVRKYMARGEQNINDAKAMLSGKDDPDGLHQEEMFEVVLQDYYPARRRVDGEKEAVYVQRELMTEAEVKRQCERMEKMGATLTRHSKALWADFCSRQEANQLTNQEGN